MGADPPHFPEPRVQNDGTLAVAVPVDYLLDRAASELELLKRVVGLLHRCHGVEAQLAEANRLVGWLQAERRQTERATWKRTGRPPRAPTDTQ